MLPRAAWPAPAASLVEYGDADDGLASGSFAPTSGASRPPRGREYGKNQRSSRDKRLLRRRRARWEAAEKRRDVELRELARLDNAHDAVSDAICFLIAMLVFFRRPPRSHQLAKSPADRRLCRGSGAEGTVCLCIQTVEEAACDDDRRMRDECFSFDQLRSFSGQRRCCDDNANEPGLQADVAYVRAQEDRRRAI